VQSYAVRSVLDSRHVTGIRVFRGLDAGEGDWPAIIDRRGWRFYLLRGLVVCKKCGWRMAGSASKDACYLCAKHTYLGAQRCHRRIGAARLEAFVTDAAVDLLTHLDVTGTPSAATAPVCDGRGGDQRSLDGHGSGSQVSTSLSTSTALPSTWRCTRECGETISRDVRFRQAKQPQLNPSMWMRSTQSSQTRYPTSGASAPGAARWNVKPPSLA
jgi:hypothetical protein